jgi:hypothetical protein
VNQLGLPEEHDVFLVFNCFLLHKTTIKIMLQPDNKAVIASKEMSGIEKI